MHGRSAQLPGTPSAARQRSVRLAPRQRSAVSNGSRLFVHSPGDGAWARRFRDVLAEIVSDLGGADMLSEGQRQLTRRAATIAIACEKLEGEAAAGHEIDLTTYGMLVDRMGRCFDRLGLKRQAIKDVTPSLSDIMREHSKSVRQDLLEASDGGDAGRADSVREASARTEASSVSDADA
jgi:hypothetical protein